uniref:Uncharacterized protein n=1 Tax=Theropithecus gelada TaxID=9565 RepID=A0A8D2EFU1_THEGE
MVTIWPFPVNSLISHCKIFLMSTYLYDATCNSLLEQTTFWTQSDISHLLLLDNAFYEYILKSRLFFGCDHMMCLGLLKININC